MFLYFDLLNQKEFEIESALRLHCDKAKKIDGTLIIKDNVDAIENESSFNDELDAIKEKIKRENEAKNANIFFYRIRKQDTKESISNRFNIPISELNKEVSNDEFFAGNVIRFNRFKGKTHKVKPFESYESISKKYNIDENRLREINNNEILRINRIIVINK